MVTPRHHIDDYRDYPDDYHGCSHDEDKVRNPRCCQEFWQHFDFDDSDSCREFYDDIDENTWNLLISEWIMGIAIIGGIVLFGSILYCCWRRGKVKNL